MKTVLFTGTGASVPFGFPLTGKILAVIREELRDACLFADFENAAEDRDELNGYLSRLMPGFGTVEQLPGITDVLSLIDHSLLMAVNPLRASLVEDLARFRQLLEKAIYDVLWPPYKKSRPPYVESPPAVLQELGESLTGVIARDGTANVITTNYDTAIDSELFRRLGVDSVAAQFDFGFAWRHPRQGVMIPQPETPKVRLYKLHGSVGWLKCELCEQTYVNPHGMIGGLGFSKRRSDANTCHCDHWPLRPVLITPSLVRTVRDANLLQIWKHSLELLRTADRWVIAGYSFPAEDIAIRSLFVRAYHGREDTPDIVIVQHRDDPELKDRYRVFFPECEFFVQGFENFFSRL